MTCIIGYIDKNNNNVTIGGDSCGSNLSESFVHKRPKVFKKEKFIFGCTTSFRMMQILEFSLDIPDFNGDDLFKYMCTDFINSVKKCFNDNDYGTNEKGGYFLVGYENRLFQVQENFQICEYYENYNCVGCGEDYARGSLFTLENTELNKLDPISKITIALDSASFFSTSVCPPYHFVQTNEE